MAITLAPAIGWLFAPVTVPPMPPVVTPWADSPAGYAAANHARTANPIKNLRAEIMMCSLLYSRGPAAPLGRSLARPHRLAPLAAIFVDAMLRPGGNGRVSDSATKDEVR